MRPTGGQRSLAHSQKKPEKVPEPNISRPAHAYATRRPPATPAQGHDARKILRYEIAARASYRWHDAHGAQKTSSGFTRDVSTRGAFVISEECPTAGAAIEIEVDIQGASAQAQAFRIRAAGTVLRTEPRGGGHSAEHAARGFGSPGFAVQFRQLLPKASEARTESPGRR